MSMTIETGDASMTTTGVEGGIDVGFTLVVDGVRHEGSCTLLPADDGRRAYESWGDMDHWLDGRTCAVVRDIGERREALDLISVECGPVALAFAHEAA